VKKLLTFLLALCYLFTGSGIVLQQHYCMGEFVDGRLALIQEDDTHSCSKCGMQQKSKTGCCETKMQLLKKVQDEQVQQAQDGLKQVQVSVLLPEPILFTVQEPLLAKAERSLPVWPNPPPGQVPIFLEYRNLRI
jgi:hypothetical protein